MNKKLIAFDELKPLKGIGYSRSQIYRKIRDGSFPRQVMLGDQRVAWVESEIDAWIDQRIRARDGKAA
jgi:prophage regulatory protein